MTQEANAAFQHLIEMARAQLGPNFEVNAAWDLSQRLLESLELLSSDLGETAKVKVTPRELHSGNLVDVYAIYRNVRVEGRYDILTDSLHITSGLPDRFLGCNNTASGAALKVIRALSSEKVPTGRRGREFWKVKSFGGYLGTYVDRATRSPGSTGESNEREMP